MTEPTPSPPARLRGASAALLALAALLAASTAPPAAAQDGVPVEASARRGPRPLDPAECGIGERVTRLPWRDLRGRPGRLGEAGALRGQVVALTDTSCPLAQKLAPALARLAERCRADGLELVLLNPSADGREEIERWVAAHDIAAPYVHDPTGELARALGALTTTDVFLLDAEGRRVYRGAIDDRVGIGYARQEAREEYLADAIDALLAGEAAPQPATWAPGCVLDLAEPEGAGELTWHGRVSRIVARRCGACHQEGGVAPFPLASRADLARRKGMLRFVVEERLMPPWGAAPKSGPWRNDHSLPEAERAELLAWLAAGLPEGDPASAAPAPPPAAAAGEWAIGTPDLVVAIPGEQRVPAEGYLDYIEFVVPLGLTEDRWVTAVELKPSAPQVVHHVIVHVLTGEGLRQGRSTLPGFLAGYVPGNASNVLPPGFAKKLPAGSRLFFQLHYTPNGTEAVDRTRLALVFQDEPPTHEVKSIGIANKRFEIPAGAEHFPVDAELELPMDIGVLSLMPHMHLRGEAFRFTADPPKGAPRTLLDVPRYDFNWQFTYRFEDPVALPRGTKLGVTGWFDNSADNPANPDPSKDVRWGDQTYEEMMIGYVEYYAR